MKAVILAGGMGTRLMPHTKNTPKCLVLVNGKAIVDYQLEILMSVGIKKVVFVVGHLSEQIIKYTQDNYSDKLELEYVENPDYRDTQNAYSLWHAKEKLSNDEEGFIILNSDLIFQKEMLQHLIKHTHLDGIIVDKCDDITSDMVKMRLEGDRIVEMSKTLDSGSEPIEAVGPVKFSKAGGQRFFSYLEKYFDEVDKKNWLFYMIGDYGKHDNFHAIHNPGFLWVEIDNLNDLKMAESMNISHI